MKNWSCDAYVIIQSWLCHFRTGACVPTPPNPPFTRGGKKRLLAEACVPPPLTRPSGTRSPQAEKGHAAVAFYKSDAAAISRLPRPNGGTDGVRGISRSVDVALIALAIVSRVAAVWVLQSHMVPRSTYEHGEIAANLLAGRGFAIKFLGADGPTSQQAPIYPAIVAIAYAIGGIETPQSLLFLELGQSILGGLLVFGVVRICRLIAPCRTWMAWTAGLSVALHPTLVYTATHVQVAMLGATLLTWVMAWAYQTAASGKTRDAAITGGLLAVLALTDPILALSMVGVAWAIWQGNTNHRRQSFGLIVVVGIVASMGVAPWLVRNLAVHGELVLIKSTFGYAFWQGNCALSEGTDKVVRASVERVLDRNQSGSGLSGLNRTLWEARHQAGYLDDIALTKADYRVLGAVSEPARSRILFRRALADLAVDPARYIRLCLRRLRYFIFFDETNPKSRVLAYRLPHLGLTIFAAIGLMLAASPLRTKLLPTTAAVGLITLFHALTIVSARFHIPLEPLLAIWGAAGGTRWFTTVGRSAAAGYHIKGIGVVGRFAVFDRIRVFKVFPRGVLHGGQFQAGNHRADADQDGTSPDNRRDGGGIIPG
jgi:hypothetical protein